MQEIDEEEGVAEIQGRETSLGKEKAQAISTSIKVSSMGSNMRSGNVGGALSKRRGPMDAYYAFDLTLKVEKDEGRRKLRQTNIKESLEKMQLLGRGKILLVFGIKQVLRLMRPN